MAEFQPYEIAGSVRKLAAQLFHPQRVQEALDLLAATELPLTSRSPERVHLALLLLSRGEFASLEEEVREAAKDWRDTLCAAGLEHENWREVLHAKGITLDP